MGLVAPLGPVYQAGTLSGNPLAMTAGIETLKVLNRPGIYEELDVRSASLEGGLIAAAAEADIPVTIHRVGSILTLFFIGGPVHDYESARRSDTELFGRFFQQMLAQGIYWPPSQFEAAFVSLVHTDEDIAATVAAVEKTLTSLSPGRQRR